jgi:hypothetical protein
MVSDASLWQRSFGSSYLQLDDIIQYSSRDVPCSHLLPQ